MVSFWMRAHATDYVDRSAKTLCGEAVTKVRVDNGDPDCKRCLRVIRSRCFEHNMRKCLRCPKDWYVLGGNRAEP